MDDFKLEWGDRDEVEVCVHHLSGHVLLSVHDYLDGTQQALSPEQSRQVAAALIQAADEVEQRIKYAGGA